MSHNYEKYLKTYTFKTVLPGNGEEIEFRSLTTNDMKRLLVYEKQTDILSGENVLDDIITGVVLNDPFDVDDLYIQDRYFLFIELRKATKGSEYMYDYECNKCKSQSIQKINLNDLEVKKMPEKINPVVELMDGNLKLDMKFIKRKDQKEAAKEIDSSLSETEKQVEMILSQIAASINSIITPEGEDTLTIKEKIDFIGQLPRSEYQTISNWYENNSFGIDLNIKVVCPHCGNKTETQLPIDNFFE